MEATGDYGVSSSKWSDIRSEIGVGKFYEKVAFRKLKCQSTNNFINTFDDFLAEVWELKYGIGLLKIANKLTNGASVMMKQKSQNKYVNEERTFFCSELVAKTYKVLGALKTQRSSTTFYPSDFESNADLVYGEGYSMGPLFNLQIDHFDFI